MDFFLADRFALGTDLLFDFIPDGVLGDHFFFSWELLTFRIVF